MSDDITVGDRFLVPVTVVADVVEAGFHVKIPGMYGTKFMTPEILSTCQRLPPEIGVGDRVQEKSTAESGIVLACEDGEFWVRFDNEAGRGTVPLSDLTLVKKAEKG